MEKDAAFSVCRAYRYALWRTWDASKGYAMFVGLNPSTADESVDDPTIRRCVAYAKDWGYGGLCMANLFAFRATQPDDMRNAADPIGPRNDEWLKDCSEKSMVVVAAWGTHGTFMGRNDSVRKMIPKLHYLRLTKDGHPGHPLYLPKSLTPILWSQS